MKLWKASVFTMSTPDGKTAVNDRHHSERRAGTESNNLCTWVHFRHHRRATIRLPLSLSVELLLSCRIEMTKKILFLFCLFPVTSALNYLLLEIIADMGHTSAFFQMIKMRVQAEIRFSRSFHRRQRSWLSSVTLPSTNLKKKMSSIRHDQNKQAAFVADDCWQSLIYKWYLIVQYESEVVDSTL